MNGLASRLPVGVGSQDLAKCSKKKKVKSRRHSQKDNKNNQLPGGTELQGEITRVLAQLAKPQQGMAQKAAHDYRKGGSSEEVEGGKKAGRRGYNFE